MAELKFIPGSDELVREYLLFRGFTATWNSFSAELASDCSCEFQATRLADLVLKDLIPNGKSRQLMEVLQFVEAHCVAHLPLSHQPLARKLETAVLQLHLVTAIVAGAYERVSSFFSAYGERLLAGQGAETWSKWFALPYLSQEAAQVQFQVYFSKDWAALTEASLRNFLAEAISMLPLPGLLRDFKRQQQLQQRLAAAEAQVTALEQQLQAARLQQPGSGAAVDAVRQQAAQTPAGTSCPGSAVGEPAAVPASRAARQPESIDRSGTATANSSSSSLEASATVPAAGPVANPEGRVPPRKGAADNSGGHSSAAAVADLLQGHDAQVTCCSFSPDGSNVATAAADGVVRVWAPASLPMPDSNRAAMLQCGAAVSCLAWDLRAGKLLLVGLRGGKGIKCWHADTKHMVAADLGASTSSSMHDAASAEVLALATSPADPIFASSTALPGQPLSGTLTLWNTRSFKRVGSLPAGRVPVSSLAFSPDGKLLAAATTDSMAQLFSPHSREPVSGWPVGGRHGGQASIVWVPGGHIAATLSEDGQLQTWDLQNPAAPALLDAAAVAASGQHAACMVASPDCTRLALAAGARVTMVHISAQGCLSVSNKPVLQLRSDVAHDGGAFRIDWHKDGELLVCTDGGAAVIVRV